MYCISYIIKAGDTLYKISRHYNVSISAIMDANPLTNVYNLMVGETICIPASVPSNKYTHFTTYLVEDGDTLGSILEKNNMNMADFADLNDMKDINLQPGTTIKVPIIGEGIGGITL